MKNDTEASAERIRHPFLKVGALGAAAALAMGLYYSVNATERTEPVNNAPSVSAEPSPVQPSSTPESTIEHTGEFSLRPTWSQEFSTMNSSALDTRVWRYDLNPEVPGYNNESQAYTDSPNNVRIEPGVGLVIEAHRNTYQYPNDPQMRSYEFTSGRIDTIESFTFEYGKVEARMKLPKGEGVWPAFWLLSGNEVHTETQDFTDQERQNGRFYLHNGEIDIMEYYGNTPGVIEGTVHTFTDSKANSLSVPDATDAFHTYGVEVTPEDVTWTMDNTEYFRVEKPSHNLEEWPFGNNNQLFVLLNLAISGPAGPTNPETSSWRLEVEHVRFYSYTGAE